LTNQIPTIRLAGEDESRQISLKIGTVIEAKMEEIGQELGLRREVELSLRMKLLEIPHRTYLWLRLILDKILNALSWAEPTLLMVINKLPTTVDDAYERLLAKCIRKEKSMQILQVILAAQRPLTVDEMDVALAIVTNPNAESYDQLRDREFENRKTQIGNLCGLFVTVEASRIHLIHQTAKEFLLAQDGHISGQGWRHSINLQQSHRILAEIVSHLLFREFQHYNAQLLTT